MRGVRRHGQGAGAVMLDRSRWHPCTRLWRGNCRGLVGLNLGSHYRGKTDWLTWVGPPFPLDANHRHFIKQRMAARPYPCGGL